MISIAKLTKMYEAELAYTQALAAFGKLPPNDPNWKPPVRKPFGKAKRPDGSGLESEERYSTKRRDLQNRQAILTRRADLNKNRLEKARIKGDDEYEWYKYNGSKSVPLLGARGEAGMMKNTLDKGTVFGVRPSSNPKNPWRLILKDAKTRVFSMAKDKIDALVRQSKPVSI